MTHEPVLLAHSSVPLWPSFSPNHVGQRNVFGRISFNNIAGGDFRCQKANFYFLIIKVWERPVILLGSQDRAETERALLHKGSYTQCNSAEVTLTNSGKILKNKST